MLGEMQKTKWLSEEVLQIAEKRREVKGKGQKERYTIECRVPKNSKRDKKAFLSDQCKETGKQQNGKTPDLFKKNQRYQGNMGSKDGLKKGQKWYGPNRSRRY